MPPSPSRSTSRPSSPRSSSSSPAPAPTTTSSHRVAAARGAPARPPVAPGVTVVVPTYNERANLGPLASRLLALRPDLDLVVADDNSPDGTGALADELAASTGRVTVLHRPGKAGIGPAYVAGLRVALDGGAGRVVCMDADGSHRPEDLPSLLDALETADVALGSRYVPGGATEGWPLSRRLLSRFGGAYARVLLGVPVHDLTGGFKAYRRDALAALDLAALRSDGYAFQIETTWQALRRGLRVVEVPITFTDRVAGKSKLSRTIVLEAVWTVLSLRLRSLRDRRPVPDPSSPPNAGPP